MAPEGSRTREASSPDDAAGQDPSASFFNTTFSTHRVSPLFVGAQPLTAPRLEQLARRLRDTLVGDVVRGIQIGLEAADTPAGQVGPLRSVTMRWVRAQNLLGDGGGEAGARLPEEHERCLWVEMRHEHAAYLAILLPALGVASGADAGSAQGKGRVDESQFVRLPLLLLRMPQALKTVVGEWLATTFDCRVNRLTLGTRTLVGIWESWIKTAGLPTKGPDFVLTLAFNAPVAESLPGGEDGRDDGHEDEDEDEGEDGDERATAPGLRALDIAISPSDLGRFLAAGEAHGPHQTADAAASWASNGRERRRLAGRNVDDGWAWRGGQDAAEEQPFTEALARYLDHHLALNLFHPGVRVVQVSCGAFVLAQSRLKVVRLGGTTEELAQAAWMFVTQLGARLRDDDDDDGGGGGGGLWAA